MPEFFLPILLFIGLAIIAVVAAYYGWRAAKKRREDLMALAAGLGFRFDPARDRDHDEEYAHFEIFRQGDQRAAYNTLSGLLEIADRHYPVKMGDFTYQVTSSDGKNTSTRVYHFSYVILHLPWPHVPDLLIRREGFFDRIAGVFGFDDIDFESVKFSREFHVKSPDKRFAYDVVDPRMMEFLLQNDCPAVDIERGRCCLADGCSLWSPREFKDTLAWASRFFNHWPDHVRASLEASQ